MDTFHALNELATISASSKRAIGHLTPPPAEPDAKNRREQLHARAHLALKVVQDRANEARKAIEQLDPQQELV